MSGDMRPAFYISLLVIGWAISLSTAADPFSRINDILNNEQALKFYAYCFLDKGPCSNDARAIKRVLPEFIASSCANCTEKQKQMACQIISIMQQPQYIDLWYEFVNKYDPVGQFQTPLVHFRQFCRENYSIVF